MRISFVTPRLAVGGYVEDRDDVDDLVRAGITHVLDVQEHPGESVWFEAQLARASAAHWGSLGAHVKYLWNPTADDGKPKPASWFKTSWDFIAGALTGEGLIHPEYKVYCHCRQGYNRGPSTVYFALRAYGSSPLQARLAIWWHRPITLFGGIRYAGDAEAALKELKLG
jgi:hypothetical protein